MATTGRLRWTLTGLMLAALAVAVLWGGFGRRNGRDVGPAERPAPTTSEAAVLEGRAATEATKELRTATRPDGLPGTLRLLAPDGRPAVGAAITYRAFDRLADTLAGVAGTDGVLGLDRAVVGKRCHVSVAADASWAAETFDVWADGEVTLRLAEGCAVWFELPPADMGRLGETLRFASAGLELSKPITEARTLLGRFAGDLRLYALGTTPAASSLNALLLPPSGEITVTWQARPEPRAVARLLLPFPEASSAIPDITLAGVESDFEGWTEMDRRLLVGGGVVLAVAPGDLTVLATAEGAWAFQQVEANPNDEPEVVPLSWTRGCALEVRLPVEPSGDVELSVRRMPGRMHDFSGWSASLDAGAGRIWLGADIEQFPAGIWPQEPRRPDARTRLWEGLPRGAHVRVSVPTERWGTLVADAMIPLEGDLAVADVPAGARFTVRAVAAGAPDPDVWLEVKSQDGRSGRTRTVGASAVVTGAAPGTEVRIAMREAAWKGDAVAVVADGLEVRVPLVRRPTARYRARVLDEAGRPLARVGVSFGTHFDVGTTVLSDADGWAEAVTASDRGVSASTAHPGLTSDTVPVPAGGEVTVVARRYRAVHVVFDIGDQVVEVDETYRGESGGGGGTSGARHVFPGSTYSVNVEPGMTHVRLRVVSTAPEQAAVLFDEEVRVRDQVATTLRVTR